MTFRIYSHKRNLYDLMRRVGYRPIGTSEKGEMNCVRPLGANYPRFHIYAKEETDIITLNLHLDQKKPSYEGAHAHSGEYEGEVVRGEVERIKGILFED